MHTFARWHLLYMILITVYVQSLLHCALRHCLQGHSCGPAMRASCVLHDLQNTRHKQ